MATTETRRNATLWMGDLEPYMDDNFLVHAFREALERPDNIVRNVKFPLNKTTGMQMGYCFVEFIDQNTAFAVLHRLGGKPMPNSNPPKRFKLNTVGDRGSAAHDRSTEWSIWVGDLDSQVDDAALFKHFSDKYPTTTNAKVVLDKVTQESRGFAFVRFSDETEQQKSMIELNNTELKGRRIRIRAAQPRNTSYQNSYAHHQPQAYNDMNYQHMMHQGQWSKPYYNNPGAQTQYPELDDQTVVEPVFVDESYAINKDFVSMSGEVYETLEASRWFGDIHPVRVADNQLEAHFTR